MTVFLHFILGVPSSIDHRLYFSAQLPSKLPSLYSRHYADPDGATCRRVDEPSDEDRPLDDDGREKEVVTDTAEAVTLQEGHQEAEPDEDHHMHVLEH